MIRRPKRTHPLLRDPTPPKTDDQRLVEKFNGNYRIGTRVKVFRTNYRIAKNLKCETTTRTAAYLDDAGQAVVFLDGVAGCWSLFAIEPIDEPNVDDDPTHKPANNLQE